MLFRSVCQRKIHREPLHLSADGDFSWEEVECLGACVNAPMVQIWKDTYEDLTPESLEAVLDGFASGVAPKPGPQNGRQLSAPLGELTSLTDRALYARERTYKRVEPAPPPPAAVAVPLPPPAPVVKAADAGPELLTAPRGGKGDDLKLVWGIGPKLEAMLHGMGVWHFDQIAAWTKPELKWVDERLEGFKGRAARDKWIAQAKKLAKGWRPAKGAGDKPK